MDAVLGGVAVFFHVSVAIGNVCVLYISVFDCVPLLFATLFAASSFYVLLLLPVQVGLVLPHIVALLCGAILCSVRSSLIMCTVPH